MLIWSLLFCWVFHFRMFCRYARFLYDAVLYVRGITMNSSGVASPLYDGTARESTEESRWFFDVMRWSCSSRQVVQRW